MILILLFFFFFIFLLFLWDYRNNNSKLSANKLQKNKRIKFIDIWENFNEKDNYFTKLLEKYDYNFEIVNKNPDIIIVGPFGILQHDKFFIFWL